MHAWSLPNTKRGLDYRVCDAQSCEAVGPPLSASASTSAFGKPRLKPHNSVPHVTTNVPSPNNLGPDELQQKLQKPFAHPCRPEYTKRLTETCKLMCTIMTLHTHKCEQSTLDTDKVAHTKFHAVQLLLCNTCNAVHGACDLWHSRRSKVLFNL